QRAGFHLRIGAGRALRPRRARGEGEQESAVVRLSTLDGCAGVGVEDHQFAAVVDKAVQGRQRPRVRGDIAYLVKDDRVETVQRGRRRGVHAGRGHVGEVRAVVRSGVPGADGRTGDRVDEDTRSITGTTRVVDPGAEIGDV